MVRSGGFANPCKGLCRKVRIAPITCKQAYVLIAEWHRHLKKVQGGLFASSVKDGDDIVGVALAANPARVWQGTGRFVIARVAVMEGKPNACSMLYGSLSRAGKALGYRECWTYTLPDEPGTSLRAAGFEDMGLTRAEEWDREKRPRKAAENSEQKRRWRRRLAA